MKTILTRKPWLLILLLCLMGCLTQAQSLSNPAAESIEGESGTIRYNSIGYLLAIVKNTGADSLPAGSCYVRIRIDPTELRFASPAYEPSLNGNRWSVTAQTSETITLTNTGGSLRRGEAYKEALSIAVEAIQYGVGQLAAVSIEQIGASLGQGNTSAIDDTVLGHVEIISVALPVQLSHFQVRKEGKTAQVWWTTASEKNSDYFEVLHSVDAKNWRLLGRVEAARESFSVRQYSLEDGDPAPGENLYRLRMVDRDGTSELSPIRSVVFDNITYATLLYPNPVKDVLNIEESDWSKMERIRVTNAQGQTVVEQPATRQLPVKSLTAGTYQVEIIRTNGAVSVHRIVKP